MIHKILAVTYRTVLNYSTAQLYYTFDISNRQIEKKIPGKNIAFAGMFRIIVAPVPCMSGSRKILLRFYKKNE